MKKLVLLIGIITCLLGSGILFSSCGKDDVKAAPVAPDTAQYFKFTIDNKEYSLNWLGISFSLIEGTTDSICSISAAPSRIPLVFYPGINITLTKSNSEAWKTTAQLNQLDNRNYLTYTAAQGEYYDTKYVAGAGVTGVALNITKFTTVSGKLVEGEFSGQVALLNQANTAELKNGKFRVKIP